jgi:hypothetical protein
MEIDFTIIKVNGMTPRPGVENIKSKDRTRDWSYDEETAKIEIEFKQTKITEIQIGIMTDVKIIIIGWHKGMNKKKQMIEKIEANHNMIKAVRYHEDNFQNVKIM